MEIESISKTAEAVKSASEFGTEAIKFVRVLTDEPTKELAGILTDKLKFYRWKNQQKMLLKAAAFMEEKGLDVPSRYLPIKELVPLLEYSSLEDDEYLQTLWAALLANSADTETTNSNNLMFIEILKNLSKLEAQILMTVFSIPNCVNENGMIITSDLPNSATMMSPLPNARLEPGPSEEVKMALANLDRLGCIYIVETIGGDQRFETIKARELGRQLVKACTIIEMADSVERS
ncbi:MAG: DUF4393 domain-containing protein [Bdellovibrionales bacterium]|nr:DUF4393 domain-containing protein [Bdellovibrionales bacterium]